MGPKILVTLATNILVPYVLSYVIFARLEEELLGSELLLIFVICPCDLQASALYVVLSVCLLHSCRLELLEFFRSRVVVCWTLRLKTVVRLSLS